MALLGSADAAVKWNAAELTAVEDCSGIKWELATGELLPFGATLKRKAVVGVYIADDVTLRVPMNDAVGSDYRVLNADYKSKTERAFKIEYNSGATVWRSLNMTIVRADPVIVAGELTFVDFTLVNTGTSISES